MQLVKHGRTTSDPWQRIDDDARLPAGTGVIVSLARWCEAATSLSNHDARIGVALGPEADIDTLGPTLRGVDLVVLEFPAFVDGRHYSNAVRLRSFYAFTGEIRAAGDVQRDQLNYLQRCGFDAFELADDVDVNDFLRGAGNFTDVYQYALDRRTPAYRLRAGLM
ncbi:MAG: DUF934 domain-containing protein [Gammaproteobacteria bacterium]|jgi:uncharacterized protein (DUF934 family)